MPDNFFVKGCPVLLDKQFSLFGIKEKDTEYGKYYL